MRHASLIVIIYQRQPERDTDIPKSKKNRYMFFLSTPHAIEQWKMQPLLLLLIIYYWVVKVVYSSIKVKLTSSSGLVDAWNAKKSRARDDQISGSKNLEFFSYTICMVCDKACVCDQISKKVSLESIKYQTIFVFEFFFNNNHFIGLFYLL